MSAFLLRRLLHAIFVVWGVVTVVFGGWFEAFVGLFVVYLLVGGI